MISEAKSKVGTEAAKTQEVGGFNKCFKDYQ